MKTKLMLYRELELIPEPESQFHPVLNWLHHVWHSILNSYSDCAQPCIHKKFSSTGKYWCVYDPLKHQVIRLDSKADVYVWLEERYYR